MKTLNITLLTLLKITQSIDFLDDIKMLISKGEAKHISLRKLMPFIDDDGLIRVGGLLHNSDLPYNVKHPILLSKNNPLLKLIIFECHEKTLHGGYVNRRYWILSGNQLAKTIIDSCMRCFEITRKLLVK